MHFLSVIPPLTLVSLVVGSCDPLLSLCPSDPALGTSIKETFSSKSSYFNEVGSEISYGPEGLDLLLAKRFGNPGIQSNFYIMFGKVEVVMKAAPGKGIVSSFFLMSDDKDEIDIELFGSDGSQYQSNYFSKGDTTTYDRGVYHATPVSPLENFLTYTLDWTPDNLTWSMNGTVNRVLDSNNPEGYPQTPMYIKTGVWSGGDSSNEPGTIEWAGGATDYSQAPFNMYIKSIVVSDYSSGKLYSYSDQSGDWKSIKSDGGEVDGRTDEADTEFSKLIAGEAVSLSSASIQSIQSSSAAFSSSTAPFSGTTSVASSTSSPTSSSPLSSQASSAQESSPLSQSLNETPSQTIGSEATSDADPVSSTEASVAHDPQSSRIEVKATASSPTVSSEKSGSAQTSDTVISSTVKTSVSSKATSLANSVSTQSDPGFRNTPNFVFALTSLIAVLVL